MSPLTAGKRLKTAPQPKKASPDMRTNMIGSWANRMSKSRTTPSRAKARKSAVSRPMWSETQPNAGRVRPPMTRSSSMASGKAAELTHKMVTVDGAIQLHRQRQGGRADPQDGDGRLGDPEISG